MKSNAVLVLIGPSGVGKSTLTGKLLKNSRVKFSLMPKYTTRPQRLIEKSTFSEDIFVSEAEFDKLDGQGFFIDTVQPFGLPYKYGLPWPTEHLGTVTHLVPLRAFVLDTFLKHFPDALIYQLEVSPDLAKQRMLNRGQKTVDIQARLKTFEQEILAGRKLAQRTLQNDSEIDNLADGIIDCFLHDSALL